MSVFKTKNNVPDVYVNASRDFQLLGRLLDLNVNDTKFNIEGIIRSLNVKTCPSRLLPLILTNLGFFTEKSFSDEVLRQILSAFPYIMKYKGSKKGIYEAVYLYLRASRMKSKFSVQITNDDIVNGKRTELDHSIVISFYDTPTDTTVLEEVLKYVVPTGYSIRYVFTKQFDADVLKQPLTYHRDYLEGVIVGNAINNQLRSTSFDTAYVQDNRVYNDLLSGVDTAVTGELNDKETNPISIPKPIVLNGIILNSWQELSWISMSSKNTNRFDGLLVGDKKLIHLSSGTIGNDKLGKIEIPELGLDLYAEIIDFDHNAPQTQFSGAFNNTVITVGELHPPKVEIWATEEQEKSEKWLVDTQYYTTSITLVTDTISRIVIKITDPNYLSSDYSSKIGMYLVIKGYDIEELDYTVIERQLISSEGYGITFLLLDTNGNPVCFTMSNTEGIKLNTEASNTGGWLYSRMRNEFLGSVKEYGLLDATSDTAMIPLKNTLMSCLPEDLRKVMKPITKYSDNLTKDHTLLDFNTTVTATKDYLPLLSLSEVSTSYTGINQTESKYCKRYSIFTNSNSRIKYKKFSNAESESTCRWWLRSTKSFTRDGTTTYNKYFACILSNGAIGTNSPTAFEDDNMQGVAPIFLV